MSNASEPGGGLRGRWKRSLVELEGTCPWAGPRPLTRVRDGSARYRFVERAKETKTFVDVVRNNRLIVLHGESGAGKSSLLDMVLLDRLDDDGYAVLLCRAWGQLGDRHPEEFLTEEFRRSDLLHPQVLEELERGRTLIDVLDDLYEGDAVIVLDQFEELIRNRRPSDFDRMSDWILGVNRSRRTKVVISLRSEYQHRLTGLIQGARPFSTTYVELPIVQNREAIQAVVESANKRSEGVAIEPDAVAAFMDTWGEAEEAGRRYGLLAVQASLYSLHYLARDRMAGQGATLAGPVVVTEEDVLALRQSADEAARTSVAHLDMFTHSFDQAIELRLAHCLEACQGLEIPEWFVHNARACVVDAAQHLSSGDYKLEREVGDLLVRSKDREFRLTGWPRDTAKRAAADLVRQREDFDYLTATRPGLSASLDLAITEPSATDGDRGFMRAQGVFPLPWVDDPRDVSAGAMLAFPASAVLLEQLRAYTFALDWLVESYLLRVTSSEEALSVALIHDGFGPPLEAWANRLGLETWAATSAVVAYEGRRFDWAAQAGAPLANDASAPRHLVNVRWRNCRVDQASFAHVVFVNCDFRGVTFERCRFEGVTFVNCLLDGASFEGCTIVGAADIGFDFELGATDAEYQVSVAAAAAEAGKKVTDMPDFLLTRGVGQVVADLRWFRGGGVAEDCLYSPTSGVSAVPWPSGKDLGVPWVPQTSGVAMYGGRLSSLMLKDCEFLPGEDGEEASLALCFMAGSSLDFVEQGTGRVHLYYSTIRGLAVTNKVDPESRKPEERFHLRAHECVLASTFFGEGLQGDAWLRSSIVLGVTSASDDAFRVTVEDSSAADGDNVVFSLVTPFPGFGTGALSPEAQSVLARETRLLAYRSVPAKLEVESRVRQQGAAAPE